MMIGELIGVYNHLLSKVFRLHYHSQKVIGSLGYGYVFSDQFHSGTWYNLRLHQTSLEEMIFFEFEKSPLVMMSKGPRIKSKFWS